MPRPTKQTVDYFPHKCKHGNTMFILERRWGNDGYAFWFKLLELLGSTDGHVYDCGNSDRWEFLLAYTGVEQDMCQQILSKLCDLGAIDTQLWQGMRLIWSSKFVDGLAQVYDRRRVNVPTKPVYVDDNPVNDNDNPQSRVEYSKVKKSTLCAINGLFDLFWQQYPVKKDKEKARTAFQKLEPTKQFVVDILIPAIEAQKQERIASAKQTGEAPTKWMYAQGWLNNKRWEDEIQEAPDGKRVPDNSSAGKSRVRPGHPDYGKRSGD